MLRQILLVYASAVFLTPTVATAIISDPFASEPHKTMICYDPVRLPAPFEDLTPTQRSKLVKNSAEFLETSSMLTMTLTTRVGAYDSGSTATFDFHGASERKQSIALEELTLSPTKMLMLNDIITDKAKAAMEGRWQRMLEVSRHYQVFWPNLIDAVTPENLRTVLERREPTLAFTQFMIEDQELTPFERERIDKVVVRTVERYEQNPTPFYGWNQVAPIISDSPFENVLTPKLVVFVRNDQRAAFLLSEHEEHVSYCKAADSAPTVEDDLREWLNSKPVRALFCADAL